MSQRKKAKIFITGSYFKGKQFYGFKVVVGNMLYEKINKTDKAFSLHESKHVIPYFNGAMKALQHCEEMGYSKIELCSDLQTLQQLLKPDTNPSRPYTRSFARKIKKLRFKGFLVTPGDISDIESKIEFDELKRDVKNFYLAKSNGKRKR